MSVSSRAEDSTTKQATIRMGYEIIECTIDKKGQFLLVPDIEANVWWISTGFSDREVIGHYHAHGESEQFHSELKTDISETASALFCAGKLDIDSRFLRLSDAKGFHERFCRAVSCHVVSISTTFTYYEALAKEMKDSHSHGLVNGENDSSPWIGNDILGWDISGFHSLLCNSLQKELPNARFNDTGLLGNEFHEVEDFARQIQGKGEPVEWIPCRIGMYE